jgi:sulfur transfer protein SufE
MSTNTLETYIETINDIKDYSEFVEWVNLLSKQLTVDPSIRTPEYFVYGCQVSTWFKCSVDDNKLFFSFDSDSNFAKGVVKILLDIIDGSTAEEIKRLSFYDFRQISRYLPTERQRTLQIILNKAHELANTTGETQ